MLEKYFEQYMDGKISTQKFVELCKPYRKKLIKRKWDYKVVLTPLARKGDVYYWSKSKHLLNNLEANIFWGRSFTIYNPQGDVILEFVNAGNNNIESAKRCAKMVYKELVK